VTERGPNRANLQEHNETDPMANSVLMPGLYYPHFDNKKES